MDTTPFYGASTPTNNGEVRNLVDYPRGAGSYVQFGNIGADLSPIGYSAASLLGAGLGGGLVGYIAAKNKFGALRGAYFAAGLAGVSDAVSLSSSNRTAAVILGLLGLGGISLAIYQFKHAR